MWSCVLQVMEEGERLSKKQLAQENTIKKLRAQVKEGEAARMEVATNLTMERQKVRCSFNIIKHRSKSPSEGLISVECSMKLFVCHLTSACSYMQARPCDLA